MIAYLKTFLNREGGRQLVKLALIGFVNTVVYFAMLNLLRSLSVPLFWRVTLSFAVATLVSYLLNRRWTFQLKGGLGPLRETLAFFAVNVVAWGITVAIVLAADAWFGPLSRLSENLVNLAAGVLILLPKLASYRDVVFRRSLRPGAGPGSAGAAPAQAAEPEGRGVAAHLPEGPERHPTG